MTLPSVDCDGWRFDDFIDPRYLLFIRDSHRRLVIGDRGSRAGTRVHVRGVALRASIG